MALLSSNLVRQTDAKLVNQIVNHPEIYPWVHGSLSGPLDLSPVIAAPNNHALYCSSGGVLFHQLQGGLYEAHTCILPEARGKQTLDIVTAAIAWMFENTDAVELVTRCPAGNVRALTLTKLVARNLGGSFEFTSPLGWVKDGKQISADFYSLQIQDWIRCAPHLPAIGADLCHQLEQRDAISMDPAHHKYIGAAISMIVSGQIQKGAIFYNRWASMAGYTPLNIVSISPLIIDIRDCWIVIRDKAFWIM